MSSFIIKTIAILTMTIDHVNDVFYQIPLLNMIGRIAFPLFCFQIVVGYDKTSNLKKYLLRLFLFAIISQIPYYFFIQNIHGTGSTNVIFTLLMGVLAMYLYDIRLENKNGKIFMIDSKGNKIIGSDKYNYDNSIATFFEIIRYCLIINIMLICKIFNSDYGVWGIILILLLNIFYPFCGLIKLPGKSIKIDKVLSTIIFLFIMIIMSFTKFIPYINSLSSIQIIEYSIFTFIPFIFVILFNGKKGIGIKYFFYIYYPLHMIMLVLIYNFFVH